MCLPPCLYWFSVKVEFHFGTLNSVIGHQLFFMQIFYVQDLVRSQDLYLNIPVWFTSCSCAVAKRSLSKLHGTFQYYELFLAWFREIATCSFSNWICLNARIYIHELAVTSLFLTFPYVPFPCIFPLENAFQKYWRRMYG